MFYLETPTQPYENYTGHPVQGKTVMLNYQVTGGIADIRVFLNTSENAYQLNNKRVESIICNTRYVSPPSVNNGNLTSTTITPGTLVTANDLRTYGYTITLVNKLNQYLVYNYPLIGLLSTSVSRVPVTTIAGRTPRTFKFFDCEIDVNKSFISTFDPSLTPKSNDIISLTFYYR